MKNKPVSTWLLTSAALLLAAGPVAAQSYAPEWRNPKIKVEPVVPVQAYAFPLRDVRLLDSPFKAAQERDVRYLLDLEPDRLLARFRQNAGLPAKGKEYGGWESQGISGHSLGHYLAACALAYASTGDTRFKQRVDYMVQELALCQSKRQTGYVGGIPKEDQLFAEIKRGDIRSSGFDLNGGWVPWYTVHKVLAGLVDAYLYTDNEQAKTVAVKLADWVGDVTQNLSEAQMQQMLACEHGGMNDALASVYALTADKKYLTLSYRFNHQAILSPLAQRRDELTGKHANTQIPKILGAAQQYELTGNAAEKTTSEFFWDAIVRHRSYANGGNSDHEHLGAPDKLADRLNMETTETCNTYNMLKLTRHLFAWQPTAALADYYERGLYNHILASQNQETGMMCYFVPLVAGGKKAYNTPTESFWCCTGTGMENHVKYGEGIYFRGQDESLYVNLYVPSELQWREKSVVIKQDARFPAADTVRLTVQARKATKFPLKLRQPGWATGGLKLRLNGKAVEAKAGSDGYVVLTRKWRSGDRVELVLPKSLYTEALPDNQQRLAMLYGPWLLAGQLGKQAPDAQKGAPVLVTTQPEISSFVQPVDQQAVAFEVSQLSQSQPVRLVPFYQVYDEHYNVYWDQFTPAQWATRQAEFEAERLRQRELTARTTDELRIGEMQPERDHELTSQNSVAGDANGNKWRHATDGGFFAFRLKTDPKSTHQLLIRYWGSDAYNRAFDVLVDGQKVATQVLENNKPGQYFEEAYVLPAALTKGKNSVLVKLQAHPGKTAGGVYGCRMVRDK
ncbi:glycoside hydrolase family 127 protein [Hymenobacter guriensis]|uniref:Glycoside hydrolase family 127 protein n=1 Tax=Hymenobacter guriensis TaxID=2793065 RepID=A0ABS0KZZ8_9BACT|nr:glycoside hydrolase family 127 protein [Hymenobacter guriensis]MBG8553430.1 glycoside hydrolase family 127 protein [Hymenobacter guriensis]